MGCCSSGQGAATQAQTCSFDPKRRGKEIKQANAATISGTGAALATAALHQDAAYWEFKLVRKGTFCVGVSRKVPADELGRHIGNSKNSKCARLSLSSWPHLIAGAGWGLASSASGLNFSEGDIIVRAHCLFR